MLDRTIPRQDNYYIGQLIDSHFVRKSVCDRKLITLSSFTITIGYHYHHIHTFTVNKVFNKNISYSFIDVFYVIYNFVTIITKNKSNINNNNNNNSALSNK